MFRNDYSEIAAPEVLKALADAGMEQNVGYGLDVRSAAAEAKLLACFGLTKAEADVHFLAGGTQTNMVVISYFLRPYEAVIACDTAHINVHETGAVEGSGHKVLTAPNADGKLLPADIDTIARKHGDEHMVKPGMVYISDTTETGTTYTLSELRAIREVCDRYGLLLFLDGARLGCALTAEGNDITPEELGKLCDVFYAGGTKNGALFGEAVVVKKKLGADTFRYHIKNRGAMLAKGFVCGIMFDALFTDGLYFRLAQHSNDMAAILRNGLAELGVELVGSSRTNQLFLKAEKELAEKLTERYGAEPNGEADGMPVVRLVTSFATKKEDCEELLRYLKAELK